MTRKIARAIMHYTIIHLLSSSCSSVCCDRKDVALKYIGFKYE